MKFLQQLCCAPSGPTGRLQDVLIIIGDVIERYGERAMILVQDGREDEITLYGSFVARKLLESTSTAILARLDPARFLILQEYQLRASSGYRAGDRHPASVSWLGDVIPEKSVNNPWASETSPDKFIRALLGGHLAEVHWPKAIDDFVSCSPGSGTSAWLEEMITLYEQKRIAIESRKSLGAVDASVRQTVGSAVLDVFKSRARELYSILSKGIHLEFVVNESAILDAATVHEHIVNTVKLSAQIGYLSHYIDSIFTRLDLPTAMDCLAEVEARFAR